MIIGITGGIGSGKTTAASYFKNKGFSIVDADAISREITEKDSEVLTILVEHFGKKILNADGSLNRNLLGSFIFSNKNDKEFVENVITSKIISIAKDRLKGNCIFDAPTLFENHLESLVDCVLLITADEDIRIKRCIKRDNKSSDQIRKIMNSQMPESKKIQLADYVVYNNKDAELFSSLEDIYKQICTKF